MTTIASTSRPRPQPSAFFLDPKPSYQEAAILPAAGPLLAAAGRAAAAVLRTQGPRLWQGARAFYQWAIPYLARSAKIGAASAGIRAGYDIADGKESPHIVRNAHYAFLGGALCGGLIPKVPVSHLDWVNRFVAPTLRRTIPYHYVGLDLLGDISQQHLVEIRQRRGDVAGTLMTEGMLAAENTLAMTAILPWAGTWGKAAQTALTVTAISVGMETYLQVRSGRSWDEIDPGRFVGTSAWGHSIVVLPEAILGGAVKSANLWQAVRRSGELGIKYLAFVNPSANNFVAKANRQNWQHVQMGNTARHVTAMWPARILQATLGARHPAAILADEGMGMVSLAVANEIWSVYEGTPNFSTPEPPTDRQSRPENSLGEMRLASRQ